MRESVAAVVGMHIAFVAWAVFAVATGMLAAASFMIGIFAVVVTIGLWTSVFIEDHSDRVVGWMWRSIDRLPHKRKGDAPPSRCALCHKSLQRAGDLRVCLKCDLVRTGF